MRQKSTDVCMCVCGPWSTEPVWTRPYLIREDTRNAIKSDKAGTSANLTNDWWNLSSGSDLIYFFLLVSLFDAHTWASVLVSQALWPHRCSIHTSLDTHTCTHMADPAEVMVDLWLFGLLCYFNVCCCTWGDTQTHIWQHDRGAQLPFPWGRERERERERESVCVCVCVVERVQRERRR